MRLGTGLQEILGPLVGDTGRTIVSAFLLTAGAVLVTGASLGAVVRRSASMARDTASTARRSVGSAKLRDVPEVRPSLGLPRFSDGESADDAPAEPLAPRSRSARTRPGSWTANRPSRTSSATYRPTSRCSSSSCSTAEGRPRRRAPSSTLRRASTRATSFRTVLSSGRSRPTEGQPADAAERTAQALVQALAHHGVEAS